MYIICVYNIRRLNKHKTHTTYLDISIHFGDDDVWVSVFSFVLLRYWQFFEDDAHHNNIVVASRWHLWMVLDERKCALMSLQQSNFTQRALYICLVQCGVLETFLQKYTSQVLGLLELNFN